MADGGSRDDSLIPDGFNINNLRKNCLGDSFFLVIFAKGKMRNDGQGKQTNIIQRRERQGKR